MSAPALQVPFAFVLALAPPPERRRAPPSPRRRARAPRQRDFRFPRARRGRTIARPRSLGNQRLRVSERDEMLVTERALRAAYTARPRILAECRAQGLGEPGNPCPWASCRHNLLIEVGEVLDPKIPPPVKLNFPGTDLDDLEETCSLRIASAGVNGPEKGDGASLERVGQLLNLTMERARQLEVEALAKVKRRLMGRRLPVVAEPDDDDQED